MATKMRPTHTTVRLSEEGDRRLRQLAPLPRFGSQVAVLEEALRLLERAVYSPESGAPDTVLEHVRQHLEAALSYVDGELMRREQGDE